MCLVKDEISGNLNMSGDGYVGRKLFYLRRIVRHNKNIYRRQKITLLLFTLLTGDPLMFILIIVGKNHDTLTEISIDSAAEMIGNEGDIDFFEKNSGPRKLHPGGSTYTILWIDTSCFICWSEKGSIKSKILKEPSAEINYLAVLPHVNGVKLYRIVDEQGRIFEPEFLEYINHPYHEWVVCIGMSYGLNIAITRI